MLSATNRIKKYLTFFIEKGCHTKPKIRNLEKVIFLICLAIIVKLVT